MFLQMKRKWMGEGRGGGAAPCEHGGWEGQQTRHARAESEKHEVGKTGGRAAPVRHRGRENRTRLFYCTLASKHGACTQKRETSEDTHTEAKELKKKN